MVPRATGARAERTRHMDPIVASDTLFVRKTLRLLRIGWLALRAYRAYRAFMTLTEEERTRRPDIPRRFARSLLDLGPLFIKLGQILSTRPDVLPPAYIAALAPLQEHVPASPFAGVRATIEAAFDGDIGALFRSFAETPVASASLAQVHLAVLPDGTPVAVKVQHPGVRDRVTEDLDLLGGLIELGRRVFPGPVRRFNLVAGFGEFRRYTLQELDYTIEATTLERFARNFSAWPDILIPRVYRDRVTPTVLTMGRVAGRRLDEITPTLAPFGARAPGPTFAGDGDEDVHRGRFFPCRPASRQHLVHGRRQDRPPRRWDVRGTER